MRVGAASPALAAGLLLAGRTAADLPRTPWPPAASTYLWAITSWELYTVYDAGMADDGSDYAQLTIQGPSLASSPPPDNGPPPKLIIPSFEAKCNFHDQGWYAPHDTWYPCTIDQTPSYTPKGVPTGWGIEFAVKPLRMAQFYYLEADFSLVFWSEYANNTWNFTASYARPQDSDLQWSSRPLIGQTWLPVVPDTATQVVSGGNASTATQSASAIRARAGRVIRT